MEKVIVTGSDGFIGRVLVERLRRIGYEVIGIDRKSGHDIREVSGLLRAGGVRYVFHLAAQTSVFNTDHQKIFDDNLEAFYYVCDHCKMYGVKLVYASSSTAEPCNTTSMYGLSKNFAERYAFIYNREATGVRLHNVYGANPRQGTLLHTLLNNECVTLYNNGANVRCFTFIDDIVQKSHIEKEILSHLDGIETAFDGGAGSGRFSILLAEQGIKVTHFDISQPMIDKAKELAAPRSASPASSNAQSATPEPSSQT